MLLNSKIHVIIFILFIVSCKTQKIAGRYIDHNNKIGPDKSEILLKKDGVFFYNSWSDILGKHTLRGKWVYAMDTIYLQADTLSIKPLLTKEESIDENYKGTKITVLDKTDNSPLVGAEVYVNNETQPYIVDTLGQVNFAKRKKIVTVKVHYLVSESIHLENPVTNNDIVIYFNPNNMKINPIYLNDKWLFKNGKLIPLNEDGDQLLENYFIEAE